MPITSIKREFNLVPNFVGILSTDLIAQIMAPGYIGSQMHAIEALNNGPWQWLPTDIVFVSSTAGGHYGVFEYNEATDTLTASGNVISSLPSGDIFVGNAQNLPSPVPMSGDISIDNTGSTRVVSIDRNPVSIGGVLHTDGAVTFSGSGGFTGNISGSTNITFPTSGTLLNDSLTAAHVLVGNASNVAKSVNLSGAITVDDAGVTTLSNGIVGYAQLDPSVVQLATVSLTSTQIQNMYDTPVLLIAAAGAGTLISIDVVYWDINFGTTQYANGGNIIAQYGNAVHGPGPAATTNLLAADLNGVTESGFLTMSGQLIVTKAASLDTDIYLSNDTSAFTAGDSPVTLYIQYRILTPA